MTSPAHRRSARQGWRWGHWRDPVSDLRGGERVLRHCAVRGRGLDGAVLEQSARPAGEHRLVTVARGAGSPYLSSRERRRSARGVPPVWQVGQYWSERLA